MFQTDDRITKLSTPVGASKRFETQYATERAAASRDQGPLGLVDRVPVDAELVTGARLELGPETEPNRRRETNR